MLASRRSIYPPKLGFTSIQTAEPRVGPSMSMRPSRAGRRSRLESTKHLERQSNRLQVSNPMLTFPGANAAHLTPDDGYPGTERFDSNGFIGESPDGKTQRGSQAAFAKQAVGIMKSSTKRSSTTPSGISEFCMNALKSKQDAMSLTTILPCEPQAASSPWLAACR